MIWVIVKHLVKWDDTALIRALNWSAALSLCLTTRMNTFFLWHHSLLQFIQDWVKFPSCLLDVTHGRLKLVGRVEAAQTMVRLSGNAWCVDIATTWWALETLIGTIDFLMGEVAAEWPVPVQGLAILAETLIWIEVVLVTAWFVYLRHILGYQVTCWFNSADIFSSDYELAEFT